MDLSPTFNSLLQKHGSPPIKPYTFRLQDLDEFLKEAYRIVRTPSPPLPSTPAAPH